MSKLDIEYANDELVRVDSIVEAGVYYKCCGSVFVSTDELCKAFSLELNRICDIAGDEEAFVYGSVKLVLGE